MTANDEVSQFIDERCETSGGGTVRKSELYGAYQRWCGEAGMRAKTKAVLGRELAKRGFAVGGAGGAYYKGIGMAADAAESLTREHGDEPDFGF